MMCVSLYHALLDPCFCACCFPLVCLPHHCPPHLVCVPCWLMHCCCGARVSQTRPVDRSCHRVAVPDAGTCLACAACVMHGPDSDDEELIFEDVFSIAPPRHPDFELTVVAGDLHFFDDRPWPRHAWSLVWHPPLVWPDAGRWPSASICRIVCDLAIGRGHPRVSALVDRSCYGREGQLARTSPNPCVQGMEQCRWCGLLTTNVCDTVHVKVHNVRMLYNPQTDWRWQTCCEQICNTCERVFGRCPRCTWWCGLADECVPGCPVYYRVLQLSAGGSEYRDSFFDDPFRA